MATPSKTLAWHLCADDECVAQRACRCAPGLDGAVVGGGEERFAVGREAHAPCCGAVADVWARGVMC